jgi:hypothetical protein
MERWHVGPTVVTTGIADVAPRMRKPPRRGATYAKTTQNSTEGGVKSDGFNSSCPSNAWFCGWRLKIR